jgi:hypothetical protein
VLLGPEFGGLKIRLSVVRFRPWPPLNQEVRRIEPTRSVEYFGYCGIFRVRFCFTSPPCDRLWPAEASADTPLESFYFLAAIVVPPLIVAIIVAVLPRKEWTPEPRTGHVTWLDNMRIALRMYIERLTRR